MVICPICGATSDKDMLEYCEVCGYQFGKEDNNPEDDEESDEDENRGEDL